MARAFSPQTSAATMINARHAWKVGPQLYEVFSRDATKRYRVIDDNGVPRCVDCPAGQRGQACWHGSVVLRRLQRESRRRTEEAC